MTIHEEVVNEKLEYSKKIIKQINHAKGASDELSEIQAIVFAGMLAYYGQEHIDDIYLAFLKADFVLCHKPIEKLISRRFNLSLEDAAEYINHCPGTFYEVNGYEVTDNTARGKRYKIDRRIYVQNDGSIDIANLVRSVAHQMNHVVNSVHRPIVLTYGKLASRMGVSLDRLASRETSNLKLEESISQLQTNDIMEKIYDFCGYDIADADMHKILAEIAACEKAVIEDDELTEVIRPLYEEPWFNYFLVDKRMLGTLPQLRTEFDSKTESGAYAALLYYCDDINFANEPEDCKNVAKSLIKKYIETNNEEVYN